jgi:protocatechuate 3,4-dioxygenase beta subunit
MHYLKVLLTLSAFFLSICTRAETYQPPAFCKATESTINNYEPIKFETANNLLRKTGQGAIFCGERILVYGRVLDQNCLPVSDAKVYIWQVNCSGKYPYKPLRNRIDKELVDTEGQTSFTGNGTATTNNNGEFVFITTYPQSVHDLQPHINVRVEHYMLGSIQSRLILRGKRVKNPEHNPELKSIADFVQKNKTNVYSFEITLPGKNL